MDARTARGLGRAAARRMPDGEAGDDAEPGWRAALAEHGEALRPFADAFVRGFWNERMEQDDSIAAVLDAAPFLRDD